MKIISDSTCDLSQQLIHRYEIGILPLHVVLGEEEYIDGKNIAPDEIYQWSDANKATPKTSAPSIEDVMAAMKEYTADGRCGGLTALAGGALKLHPQIVVDHGTMKPEKKYRGKMEKVILNYVKDMEAQLLNARKERVFITHSGCDDQAVQMVRQYLEQLHVFDEILVTRAGSVISSHYGPGTLGGCLLRRRDKATQMV